MTLENVACDHCNLNISQVFIATGILHRYSLPLEYCKLRYSLPLKFFAGDHCNLNILQVFIANGILHRYSLSLEYCTGIYCNWNIAQIFIAAGVFHRYSLPLEYFTGIHCHWKISMVLCDHWNIFTGISKNQIPVEIFSQFHCNETARILGTNWKSNKINAHFLCACSFYFQFVQFNYQRKRRSSLNVYFATVLINICLSLAKKPALLLDITHHLCTCCEV